MIADHEFRDKPFGSSGEMFSPTTPAPTPPATRPFVIEPPPWVNPDGSLDMSQIADATSAIAETPPAHATMQTYDPRPWAPPVQTVPLTRFVPPPADWRAEDEERTRREQAEQAAETQARLEPEQPAHPLKRGWRNR